MLCLARLRAIRTSEKRDVSGKPEAESIGINSTGTVPTVYATSSKIQEKIPHQRRPYAMKFGCCLLLPSLGWCCFPLHFRGCGTGCPSWVVLPSPPSWGRCWLLLSCGAAFSFLLFGRCKNIVRGLPWKSTTISLLLNLSVSTYHQNLSNITFSSVSMSCC